MKAQMFKPAHEWPGYDVEAQFIMLMPPNHVQQFTRRAYTAQVSPIEGQNFGVMTRKSHEIFDSAAAHLETVEKEIADTLQFGSSSDDYDDEVEIVRTTPDAAYLAREIDQAIEIRKDAKDYTRRPVQRRHREVSLLILGPVFSSFDESLCTVYGSSPNV